MLGTPATAGRNGRLPVRTRLHGAVSVLQVVDANARLPFRPYSHLEEGEKEHVRTCRIELFPDGARCGEYLRGEPLLDFD